MDHGIAVELHFFLMSVLWGALVLLAYDQLRVIRRVIRHNTVAVAIQDVIFWIAASVFIFALIYVENSGIIRGFSIMGMAIGMILYHYMLSDLIVTGLSRLIRLLLYPFNKLFKQLKKWAESFKILFAKIKARIRKAAAHKKGKND